MNMVLVAGLSISLRTAGTTRSTFLIIVNIIIMIADAIMTAIMIMMTEAEDTTVNGLEPFSEDLFKSYQGWRHLFRGAIPVSGTLLKTFLPLHEGFLVP